MGGCERDSLVVELQQKELAFPTIVNILIDTLLKHADF